MVYPPSNQQILLESGWLAYYCHFLFGAWPLFRRSCFLNNDTPIPILLPYHSQREFLQVWEWYGKLSFRECTTTLALNSTRKVSPLPWTVVRDQDRKEMKLQMKIMKTENPQVQTRKGLACIYYTEVYTHTQTIFFHHHRWFLSVDPSLKILGNVTVIDSDCRNFTRRSQSWKIDPTFLRNTILCPWQYFLLMMIHWWLRLVAYIPITRTSPINHWMTHDWHFLGTANHHWASMLFLLLRYCWWKNWSYQLIWRISQYLLGFHWYLNWFAAFLNHRHPLTKVNQPADG